MFNLYTRKKTWSEAKTYCQKEGGHLASVTSNEVNQMVTNMAAGNHVWLGGRKVLDEWSWSDNSTWGFTKWDSGQPDGGDGSCVYFYPLLGNWYDSHCANNNKIIRVVLELWHY